MKKLLLPIAALLLSANVNAQTYFSEDFTGGTLGQFTSLDNDGDGNEWSAGNVTLAGSEAAVSNSWLNNVVLTPDNFLTTTAVIDLTAAVAPIELSFLAGNPEATSNWWEENYDVILSTSNVTADIIATTPVFTEVLPSGGAMLSRIVNLDAYAGQSVYLTFRHYNCTDENFLTLDNILVRHVNPNEIKLVSLSNTVYSVAGSVNITGTVKNDGSLPITSFDLDWNDGTAHMQTITANIAPGATYDFSHPTALTVVGGTDYTMTVCATIAGDVDASNNCLDQAIAGMTQAAVRTVVGEEKTGTWCGWCPRGAVGLAGMESNSNFIGIAVHNGDPMVVASYDSNIGTYVPGGYPGGGVDRVIEGDPSTFAAMYTQRAAMVTPVSVGVTATIDMASGLITVNATADIYASLNGDYRLAVVLIEDNVTGAGSGYNQANYYDDGAAGALEGAGLNWVGAGNPVPAADMEYDHVARALGDDQILGATGSVPATNAAGSTVTKTYTFTADASWNAINMHAVAMFVNGTTGEIMNAGKTEFTGAVSVNEIENNFNVSVYPNPTTDFTNVRVELTETSNVSIQVYNTLGKLVHTENNTNVSNGAYYFVVNTSEFASGLYTVNTTVNGNVQTTKLSVR